MPIKTSLRPTKLVGELRQAINPLRAFQADLKWHAVEPFEQRHAALPFLLPEEQDLCLEANRRP